MSELVHRNAQFYLLWGATLAFSQLKTGLLLTKKAALLYSGVVSSGAKAKEDLVNTKVPGIA